MKRDNYLTDLQAGLLNALAHPNRIRILEIIRGGSTCNCEIAPRLNLEQSNLSRHLKLLVHSGVLVSWKEGLRVNYKIADERVFEIMKLASAVVKASHTKKSKMIEA